jgi:large subunit ribosomal protein L3
MAIGLIGRKCGMTRVFTEAGETVPVTVIEVLPNRVTQLKSVDKDGYRAVQVTYGTRRPQLLSKAAAGHLAKASVAPGRGLVEFRLPDKDAGELKTGAELKVDQFQPGEAVDVTGTTIGKGFAGTMKRHNFAGGYASHGNSVSHRAPGSIGQRQTPGRVFKGKRMSGHMGVMRRTTENLRVVEVDLERNLLLIRGAVPGAEGGNDVVRPSLKAARRGARKTIAPTKGGAPAAAKPGAAGAKPAAAAAKPAAAAKK